MRKSFKNTLKQNLVLFSTFILLNVLLSAAFENQVIYQLGYIIRPKIGLHQLVRYTQYFNLFVLPWRPVRRFLWNLASTAIAIVKPSTKPSTESIKVSEYTIDEIIEINNIDYDQIEKSKEDVINKAKENEPYSSSQSVYDKLMRLSDN